MNPEYTDLEDRLHWLECGVSAECLEYYLDKYAAKKDHPFFTDLSFIKIGLRRIVKQLEDKAARAERWSKVLGKAVNNGLL